MADETPKVVNLFDERIKRNEKAAIKAHEDGELFKFEPFEFVDDEETPNGIGIIEGDKPISLLLSIEKLSGICMDVDTARRLAKELEGVCHDYEQGAHWRAHEDRSVHQLLPHGPVRQDAGRGSQGLVPLAEPQ